MRNPRCAVRLTSGTWACNPNTARGTHAEVDMMTWKDTTVALREHGRRHLGAACTTHSDRRAFGHRMTSPGTPPRSYSTSPPSMPPPRKRSGLYLAQAVGKQPLVEAGQCRSMLPSKAPRRTPRAARRGESGDLSGLQPRPTTTTTTKKRMTLTRSESRPLGTLSSTRCDRRQTTLRDSSRRPTRTTRTLSSTSSRTVV
jgi:hypothetical protein